MKQYTLLSCIESKMIHPTQLYGRFELGSFGTGQAVTVANTLRRALLSQLPGVAITLVHIANVSHEYESVPGIQEPVLDILSNLKKIVFTSEFEVFQPQIGYLHLKGPAVVRAGDLKLPFFITCVHPEQYITTLTEHGDFRLTVLINSGKQYLNHTPDSTGYHWRVSLLKQQLSTVNSPLFIKQKRNFYMNWHQQQKTANTSNFLQKNAHFVKSKIAQKLWKRQQLNQQTKWVRKTQNQSIQETDFINPKPSPFSLLTDGKVRGKFNVKKQLSSWGKWSNLTSKDPNQIRKNFAAAIRNRSAGEYELHLNEFRAFMEEQNKNFTTKGYFPVNAFFSPVTKVNYTIQVEENRIGEYVCLEVWTNGSIDPRRAIHRSVKALMKLFLPFQLIERENNQFISLEKNNSRKIHQIKKTEFKKSIEQFRVPMQSLSQSEQTVPSGFEFLRESELPANSSSANLFLKRFIKERVSKPLRRKTSKKRRWPAKWSQLQERRRTSLYTYVQPISTTANSSLLARKRKVLRSFRMFFPLFNIVDRFVDLYGLNTNQYDKLSKLNILNLELPFGIYKFLWHYKIHSIDDLFFIHNQMIKDSMPVKKKRSFYYSFNTAFSKLFYQWTGKTQAEAKIIRDQKYNEDEEEKQKNNNLKTSKTKKNK